MGDVRMPRRREVPQRAVMPDSKYKSKLVAKFHQLHDERRQEEARRKRSCTVHLTSSKKRPRVAVKGFRTGPGQCQAGDRGEIPPGGGLHLPGAHGNPAFAANGLGHSLDHQFCPQTVGKRHGQQTGRRTDGCANSRGAAVKKREDTHKWPRPTRHLPIIDGKQSNK